MQEIVIIGGGLSARLLTIHLVINAGSRGLNIILIECQNPERMGDGFCTDEDVHLLNVPADKMSVFPDKCDHLPDWLEAQGYDYTRHSFIPRRLYKAYVNGVFEQVVSAGGKKVRVSFVHDEATDIEHDPLCILLLRGGRVRADRIVLAVGNFPPAPLKLANNDYLGNRSYYGSVWHEGFLRHVRSTDDIFILGTGLTMVDAVLQLNGRSHEGMITALSSHGLAPSSHKQVTEYPSFLQELEGVRTAVDLLRIVKRHLRTASLVGKDWRAVVDAIRPHTQRIWMGLHTDEKNRFLRHLKHFWAVARHRMPPEIAYLIEDQIRKDRLKIIAGKVTAISGTEEGNFMVWYRPRNSQRTMELSAGCIINCGGPASNWNNVKQRLLRNLINKGIIAVDDTMLGINCTPDGRVISKKGITSNWLFAIGPPTRGILLEITAVPEIGHQAVRLAKMLVENVYDEVKVTLS